MNEEITFNKKLIKQVDSEVDRTKRQNIKSKRLFDHHESVILEHESSLIESYLNAFNKIKPKNKIVRSYRRPFQYVEPLILIKSALIRRELFNWRKEIIDACDDFLYENRIFLQGPTQLYPMIDLLSEVCYNSGINFSQDDGQMLNLIKLKKLKKLKIDKALIDEEHFSSEAIVKNVYDCVVSEIRRNFKSVSKAAELIDYAMFLIGKELQNQFLLRMFVDEYYQNIHSNLDALFPTLIGSTSCKTDKRELICLSANGVSVVSVPDGKKDTFFDYFSKKLNKDFVSEAKIRYFPAMRLCLVEEGNHRVTRAMSKDFCCVEADVIDIRFALLYRLVKLKSTLFERYELDNRIFLSSNIEKAVVKDLISKFIVGEEVPINIPLDYILSYMQYDFDVVEQALSELSDEKNLSKYIKITCPNCGKEKIKNNIKNLQDVTDCQCCHKKFFTVENSTICYVVSKEAIVRSKKN